MLISEHLNKIELEAEMLGIPQEQIRLLVAEFWQIEKKDPDSFAELIEVVLC